MKKNKSILQLGLVFGATSLICLNLISCNKQKNEYIEVGLNNNHDNLTEYNPWNEFYTGLKTKIQTNKSHDIEVFYGNSVFLDYFLKKEYYESINQKFEIDNSQNLRFKLTRYVYSSEENCIYNRVSNSKEILVIENTLGYFMSDEFRLHQNSMLDTIEVKDLVKDYDEFGVLEYKFSIIPIENEPIKIFIDGQPVYLDNSINSYFNCRIEYAIDTQNQISFIEKEEKKENVNV